MQVAVLWIRCLSFRCKPCWCCMTCSMPSHPEQQPPPRRLHGFYVPPSLTVRQRCCCWARTGVLSQRVGCCNAVTASPPSAAGGSGTGVNAGFESASLLPMQCSSQCDGRARMPTTSRPLRKQGVTSAKYLKRLANQQLAGGEGVGAPGVGAPEKEKVVTPNTRSQRQHVNVSGELQRLAGPASAVCSYANRSSSMRLALR